ncbi:hypothetical protein DV736_g553, partial [Chaetothyriales sp. CBS 134916]
MNHLPLPRDATIGHFPIPLLTDSLGDCGSFEDYPKRHGWALTLRDRVLEFQHDQRVISDETQIGQFLQTWLYFGLLREFGFTNDFVVFQQEAGHEHGTRLLTSACLSEFVPARAQLMREEVKNMTASGLEEFAHHLQKCLQMTWTTLRWLVASAGALLSAICLSTATLAEALEFSVDNGSVQVIQASAEASFVAISHVWADGMGNQTDNRLPACILDQLQECVNAVMCKEEANECNVNVPFWIDTLCLPRRPMELRRKGIANMSEAFKGASVVLVMDSYLRDVDSTAISGMEAIARIAVSNWTLRLWTFSEGRLAKRTAFQFRDRAIEPLALVSGGGVEEQQQQIDVFSGSPSDFIMVDILKMYNATATLTAAIDLNNLATLRHSLKTRSTSWQPDEALCLGYILGLDMVKLLEARDSDKMQTFWSIMGPVPLGIAFSDTKTKIQARGYRWAPTSFTGNLEAESWLGPPSLSNKFAVPSPIGLVSELPALFFNDEHGDHDGNSPHLRARCRLVQRFRSPIEVMGPLEFKHENGHWYHCVIDDPAWHQEAAGPSFLNEESKFAILLADNLPHQQQQDASTKGLLITYQDAGSGVEPAISATVHFHVIVNLCTDVEDQYMEYLRKAVFNLVWDLWIKPSAIHDEELHALARRVHQQRIMQDDVAALMIYCCDYVAWFLRMGEWYKIRDGKNIKQWCID